MKDIRDDMTRQETIQMAIFFGFIAFIMVVTLIQSSRQDEMAMQQRMIDAGLEQCESGTLRPDIWVKDCSAVLKARNEYRH